MQKVLLALYPKTWRERYGEEYQALLDDTSLTAANLFDIARAACLIRLRTYENRLIALSLTCLYTLNGIMCIRFGLTDNWPIWAPTTPARALGLAITLAPLVGALCIQFVSARDNKHQWRGSSAVFWTVVSTLTILSTLVLALMCSFFMLSTGLFGISGGLLFVGMAWGGALTSLGVVKLLHMLQGRLLHRFAR